MFRLQIIKYLAQKAPQLCVTIPELRLTSNSTHFRMLSTKVMPTLTSHVKPPESEEEFLVRLKNDPDIFGKAAVKEIEDEADLEEEKYLEDRPLPTQKLRTKQYADIIKKYIKNRQLKEAIDVLEIKMIKEDRVKPESYIYNLLLGACGRLGYTKKAFSLYNEMKKRGLKPSGGTYTALFNACANSPWIEDGLSRAEHLRNIMIEKMYEPNHTNYNAMIKAFGRCGDLVTAFSLVDEMASKGFKIKDDTINFLLQACIQDREAGFRHALLVWRKVVSKNIAPTNFTYNLMIRCVRDCGIGDVEVMNETLQKIINNGEEQLKLEGGPDTLLSALPENQVAIVDNCRPNLMATVPHLGAIISLTDIHKAEDRLLLLGGAKGFLDNMIEHQCAPDIKTLTQLLDCLPGTLTAEKDLIRIMKKFNVKPDIDFFNMLIKKRSMRFDYETAKAVLKDMEKHHLRPDLITYGVLSLGCKTKEEALELLEEMKSHSYRLNIEILGTMLHQACHHYNFSYVLEIMEISLREQVQPNKIFMECLAKFKRKCKDISNDKDNKMSHNIKFQKGLRIFLLRYRSWLNEVEVDSSDEVHPWTQFRQNTETDVKHFKDTSTRFKPRRLSRFKVKTSTKK